MTRRQELKAAMRSGGTAAPRGKGQRSAKSKTGSPLAAAAAIADRLAKKNGMRRLPGGGLATGAGPAAAPRSLPTSGTRGPIGAQGSGKRRGPIRRGPSSPGPIGQARVGSAVQPGLGGQLSRRVGAGEIDQAQAQRTAKERAELKTAYGSDWRQEIYGQDLQNLRLGLAGAHKKDPKYEAAMKAANAARRKALQRAREKAAGAVSSGTAAA